MSVTEATSPTHLLRRGDCSHFKNARDISIPAARLVHALSVFFFSKSRKKEINCLLSAEFLDALLFIRHQRSVLFTTKAL